MITTKNLRNLKNKSTLYIKYVDNKTNTSDGLYAIKKHDNQWIVGGAILSNKQIVSIYNRIEGVIDNNWRREGFHYLLDNNLSK